VLNGRLGPSGHVSDKLFWHSPHALEVLFSPQHGMYIWSPILLIASFGLLLALKRHPRVAIPLLVALVLTVYINGAFNTWSTAGSFGARRFVNGTVIFGLGLAAGLDLVRGRFRSPLVCAPVILLVLWNAGLMIQFALPIMDRQALHLRTVVYNQFVVVPQIVFPTLLRFLTDRGSFTRID
jgi:hypothetical protein